MLTWHRTCGTHVDVQVRCAQGHTVEAEDLDSVPGPGFRMRSAD